MESNDPKNQAQLNANASKTMRTAPKEPTKVNSQERTNRVEEFKASMPGKGGRNRESMIAWAQTNPNRKSNAARRIARNKNLKPKPPQGE